jgi:hypothetical protein
MNSTFLALFQVFIALVIFYLLWRTADIVFEETHKMDAQKPEVADNSYEVSRLIEIFNRKFEGEGSPSRARAVDSGGWKRLEIFDSTTDPSSLETVQAPGGVGAVP